MWITEYRSIYLRWGMSSYQTQKVPTIKDDMKHFGTVTNIIIPFITSNDDRIQNKEPIKKIGIHKSYQ